MEFTKNCPKCRKVIEYCSKSSLIRSIKMNCICKNCLYARDTNFTKKELKKIKNNQQTDLLNKLIKTPTKYKKECPVCNKTITYTHNYTLQQSLKEKWNCQSCSQRGHKINPKEKEAKKIQKSKEYSNKNKDRIKIQSKAYRKRKRKDPEYLNRLKKYAKEYGQRPEAIEKNRIRRNEYNRIQRKNPLVRMNRNVSSSIRQSLKLNTLSKNKRHWEDIVGYTSEQLKDHLENLFQPGMSWNNYGKNGWVIDHIIPKVFFYYKNINDIEFRYCWSLHNLQPLWKKENQDKKDKIIFWRKEIDARNIDKILPCSLNLF